jgi:hypothetical protein
VENKKMKKIIYPEFGPNADNTDYVLQCLTSDRNGIIPELYDKDNPTNVHKLKEMEKMIGLNGTDGDSHGD